jgi:hypothetical protein
VQHGTTDFGGENIVFPVQLAPCCLGLCTFANFSTKSSVFTLNFSKPNFQHNMKKFFFLTALAVALASVANAQIKTPQPSPTAKVSQEVGLTKIEVEYSRPSAKGRKIFGELVPFGEIWRTGANASTKVMVGEDAKINGLMLPKGSYALYTIPGPREWTVIFYKNTTFWGTPEPAEYKSEDEAVRVVVPASALKEAVETFTISVGNLKNNGADLEISWENTKVAVPMTFDVDSKVMADIKAQMEGPSAGTYNAAARYYYEEKKDMNQALAWVDQALAKGGDKFWILRLKANILAERSGQKRGQHGLPAHECQEHRRVENEEVTLKHEATKGTKFCICELKTQSHKGTKQNFVSLWLCVLKQYTPQNKKPTPLIYNELG